MGKFHLRQRVIFSNLSQLLCFETEAYFTANDWIHFFKVEYDFYEAKWKSLFPTEKIFGDRVEATVREMKVIIKLEVINGIIGCPASGIEVFQNEVWRKEENVSWEDIDNFLFEPDEKLHIASRLKADARVLHNFLMHCILPRIGNRDKVFQNDKSIMYNLIKRKKMNLANIIFENLERHIARYQTSSEGVLIYGMLLTKAMKLSMVPLKKPSTLAIGVPLSNIGTYKRMKGSIADRISSLVAEQIEIKDKVTSLLNLLCQKGEEDLF